MKFFSTQAEDRSGQAGPSPDLSGQAPDHTAEAEWLSVPEAVVYCETQGLRRNIKTVRRWAARSLSRPESAELVAREQDIPNGFRHMIERSSLDRKIAQVIAFEANRAGADMSADAQTGPDMAEQARDRSAEENEPPTADALPQPVRTEADRSDHVRKLEVTSIGDDFLKDKITQKDTQIGELNDQIRRRDEQIMTLLERDRETNVLIKGLQHTLWHSLGIEPPHQPGQGEGDSAAGMPPPRDV